jgi:hypothetical protein
VTLWSRNAVRRSGYRDGELTKLVNNCVGDVCMFSFGVSAWAVRGQSRDAGFPSVDFLRRNWCVFYCSTMMP